MRTKQTIAVIGATGKMGSAISGNLAGGNYRLLLHANGKEQLNALVKDIFTKYPSADVEAYDCSVQASWEADIIILAVPYEAEKDVAQRIREMANQKIVISIANPLNSKYDGLVTSPGTSAAGELQQLLPNSKVVKAFNTTFAADFATPVIAGEQADPFIAGDHDEAVQTVCWLENIVQLNQ
jgi:predicted dinucleotide-binding enzyme